MGVASWAVGIALLLGSIRALGLWRFAARADVVNVVVMTTLAQGRGKDLGAVLDRSGSGLYLEVARAVAEPADKLLDGEPAELRARLERDARIALSQLNRKLRRHAWLDALSVVAIGLAGVTALVGERPSLVTTLGLVAASLLWLSNVRGARSTATQAYAAALALVDGLLESRESIRAASHSAQPPG